MRVDAYYVYCRTACNVLGLCSLEVKSIPLVRTIKSFSGHCQVSPGREGKIVSSWKQPTWMKRGLHSLPEDSGHFYMIMILYRTFFFFFTFSSISHKEYFHCFFLRFCFDVDHLKSHYWICYFIVFVTCFGFFGQVACGILASWPGIEPTPPALEGKVLTTGQPGKSFHC